MFDPDLNARSKTAVEPIALNNSPSQFDKLSVNGKHLSAPKSHNRNRYGAKSPEIPQKEGVSGSEIATRNRRSLATFHRTLKSQRKVSEIASDFWGLANRKSRSDFGALREVLSVILPVVSRYTSHLYRNTPPHLYPNTFGRIMVVWANGMLPNTLAACVARRGSMIQYVDLGAGRVVTPWMRSDHLGDNLTKTELPYFIQDHGKGGLSLRGVAFMTVFAVLTFLAVLESNLPSFCLSYKIHHNEATVAVLTVLAVSAVMEVSVMTATNLKLNPPFP